MPELPEVEVTKLALEASLKESVIAKINVRNKNLRWPVDEKKLGALINLETKGISRRGKYILLSFEQGTILLHLGMSGSIGVFNGHSEYHKHDHIELVLNNKKVIRFNDPRRFGCLVWTSKDPYEHKLIKNLGVEPLEQNDLGEYLYQSSRKRKTPVKNYVMNSNIVVGIGNIYASESLFRSGINPVRACNRISEIRYKKLAKEIKLVLSEAIEMGGTTLRNFTYHNEVKQVGYFKQNLFVYGRAGLGCKRCGSDIKDRVIGGRSSFFCRQCQV